MSGRKATSKLVVLLQDKVFGRYLLATNTISCGVLMGAGDFTMQNIEHIYDDYHHTIHKKGIDWKRMGCMTLTGLFLGPLNHGWYHLLDKTIAGAGVKTVAKKILCDQLVASPVFTFTFFTSTGLMEGDSFETCMKELREKFWTVYKADWSFWPAAQAINFYFLPSRYRVLYVSCATYIWDVYMSYIKFRDNERRLMISDVDGDSPVKMESPRRSERPELSRRSDTAASSLATTSISIKQ